MHVVLRVVLLIFSFAFLVAVRGQAAERSLLLPVYVGDRGGYINEHGKLVIPPRFDEVKDFAGGMAAVRSGPKWGYIDESGTLVIPHRFDWAGNFFDGLAPVFADGKIGYLKPSGEWGVRPRFRSAGEFSDGLARVSEGEKWGYIDAGGKVVIPLAYDHADDFREGLAVVAMSKGDGAYKVGYINKRGERMFGGEWFVGAGRFSGGVAIVTRDAAGFTTGYHDKIVFDNYDTEGGPQKTVTFEVIDATGRKLFAGRFQQFDDFSEGLAAVRVGDKYGFVNTRGEMVVPPKFELVEPFSGGIAYAYGGGKRFYIDRAGQVAFAFDYSDSYNLTSEIIRVVDCSNNAGGCKGGYMNRKGEMIWMPSR